jgi:hypothetical protein
MMANNIKVPVQNIMHYLEMIPYCHDEKKHVWLLVAEKKRNIKIFINYLIQKQILQVLNW